MGAVLSPGPGLARTTAVLASAGTLLLAAAASLIPGLLGETGCSGDTGASAPPSAAAERTIPAAYLTLYQQAGAAYAVPWPVLAAIGAIESDHGRSSAPGVQSGVNAFGCCAGPMQFNLRDGPPSTWQTYRVDGDRDGDTDPYDPADAIASAGALPARPARTRPTATSPRAVLGYNHSSRLRRRRARARPRLQRAPPETPTGRRRRRRRERRLRGRPGEPTGPANLRTAERREAPRAYAPLPAWAMAGGRPAQPIDARLLENALWLLRNYRLRVTAAREAGHNTHGDGTALDLVPAEPVDQAAWDASAGALARDLGWTPACGASGSRPACPLVPAIQFVGYDGYPGHGSPRTCSGELPRAPAHLLGLAVLRHRARRRRRARGSSHSQRMPPSPRAEYPDEGATDGTTPRASWSSRDITSAALVILFVLITSPLSSHAMALAARRRPRREREELSPAASQMIARNSSARDVLPESR